MSSSLGPLLSPFIIFSGLIFVKSVLFKSKNKQKTKNPKNSTDKTKKPNTLILFTFVFIYKNLYSQHVLLGAVLKLLAESILYKLNNLAPCFICKGSMYLCLPTSICKGVSERPRIRRAGISFCIEETTLRYYSSTNQIQR